jgi:low temperature requirement protein LtrA
MSLISLVVVLIVVGFLLWLVQTQIPMDATIKKIISIVVIVAVCIWLLTLFGLLPDLNVIRVGK